MRGYQDGDAINVYNCQASASRYYEVINNFIEGNMPKGVNVTGYTGAAITTDGDPGTMNPGTEIPESCQYIEFAYNTAVHCSGGICIAYGMHNLCHGNLVVCDGVNGAGEYYQNWIEGVSGYKAAKSNHLYDNQCAVTMGALRNDFPAWGGTSRGEESLFAGQAVTKADEDWAVNQWRKGIRQNGITIGAQWKRLIFIIVK
jgi:hypothetical protein